MSGWTVITVRGRACEDYDAAEYNDHDPWNATADLAASFENDDRVYQWTTWGGHVYAYLSCERYGWEFAEAFLADYWDAIAAAVVLGANDTSDTGTARYYPTPDGHTHEYAETQAGDGTNVGEVALAVMTAQHDIVARDPFHNQSGLLDDRYLDDGTVIGGSHD